MAKRWLYVKVKWEGTNVAKVIRVQTGEKKGDSMGRFLLPEEYSYLLGEIDKISLYEGKRLVCIDKEGDEIFFDAFWELESIIDILGLYDLSVSDRYMTVIVKKETLEDFLRSEFEDPANSCASSLQVLNGEEKLIPPLSPQPTNEEDEIRGWHKKSFFNLGSPKLDFPQEAASFEPAKADEGLIFHDNVVCDACDMLPIIGNRYKCAVRQDFDLCENCQENDSSPFPYLKIKHPSQSPAAICCVLRDPKHASSAHKASPPLWKKEQPSYACVDVDEEGGISNLRRTLNEFVSDCQWIGCKMREKHRRLKKKGVRVVRASSHHHKRKVKKSSKEGSCDENNIKSCSECLGYSGNDHPSSRIEPESEPVNFEEGEGLKSEITEMLVQNQPTPGCEDVKLNNEGTIMAASVRSDDCSSTSLSNTTTSSPSLVGGASIAQNKNTTSMVRFVADVTAPDLTSFSPGQHFVKTWCLRNDGPGAVPADSRLVWVSGDRMGGPSESGVPLGISQPPGSQFDVSVQLVVPEVPGRYVGYWRLRTQSAGNFGHQLWTDIMVEDEDGWITVPTHPGMEKTDSSDDLDINLDATPLIKNIED